MEKGIFDQNNRSARRPARFLDHQKIWINMFPPDNAIFNVTYWNQVFLPLDYPFKIDAMVVLPEHLHCVWTLPLGNADYKTRCTLIKASFSRLIPLGERRSTSRIKRDERCLWQRRYWEHLIRDELDLERHLDYIHWNPVKHGWVKQVKDWPHSSFHRFVRGGVYPLDWVCQLGVEFETGE